MGNRPSLIYTASEWLLNQGTPIAQLSGQHDTLVRDAFEALSETDQTVLAMIYYERITYREAAEQLGLSTRQAAHQRTKRALRRLRKELLERNLEL